jgi:hypothetical protein
MKQLPKYFAIKNDIDNPLWDKYISWLNDYAKKNGSGSPWSGAIDAYYGVTDNYDCGNTGCHYQLRTLPEGTVELTLEQWDEIVNGVEFPERWYCVVTLENKQILNEWKATFLPNATVHENELILSYHSDGSYYYGDEEREFLDDEDFSGYEKITTEQFIKHVLKQETPKQMKKININLSFLQEGFKSMNAEQQKLVRENVDGFTGETTEDFIKKYYETQCCGNWKQRMEKEFPFLKTKEIDLSKDKVDGLELFKKDGYKLDSMISIRSGREYANKAFYLNDKFNWEIKKDSEGLLCLVPTRK